MLLATIVVHWGFRPCLCVRASPCRPAPRLPAAWQCLSEAATAPSFGKGLLRNKHRLPHSFVNRGIPVYILFTSAVLNYSEESARTLCPSEAGEAGQGESQGIPVLRGAVAAFLETSLTMTRTFGKGYQVAQRLKTELKRGQRKCHLKCDAR